jgi:hypothetical protein
MAIIELVEELVVAEPAKPAKKAGARKAAKAEAVEALAGGDEAEAPASTTPEAPATTPADEADKS